MQGSSGTRVPPGYSWRIDPPIDLRPNVTLAALTCDVYVTRDGIIHFSNWNAGMNVLKSQG